MQERSDYMKVMISQPMKNKTEEQIREERTELVQRLTDEGHEVVDTVFTEEAPKNCDAAIYYLAKSIEEMAKVGAVAFMKDWEKARGCKIEHEVAVEYGKEVFYENN